MSSNSVEKALELIESINTSQANLDQVKRELIPLVRQAGAGAYGERGEPRERMIEAVRNDKVLKDRFIQLLDGEVALARSWAASFVEQLFGNAEATRLISKALQAEADANSASWMALNLARLHRAAKDQKVCKVIKDAYKRFIAADNIVQFARAWGYAGCDDAIPVLTGFLEVEGYDQKNVALDGLLHYPGLDDGHTIAVLLDLLRTVKWDDMRQRCALVLTQVGRRHRTDVLSELVRLLVDEDSTEGHRQAALLALKQIDIPASQADSIRQKLIDSLYDADSNLRSLVTELLEHAFEDWETVLVDLILETSDMHSVTSLARALAVDKDSRSYAVKLLEAASGTADMERKNRIAAALKEVGGERAFESVSSILQARYIEPSERLQNISEGIFKDTIDRMRSNYDTAIRMNRIVFWLGVGVIVAGVTTVLIDPESQFFGAAGVVSGLGTLVSLFFFGPIGRIQKALENLVLVEVSFMSFMHRILQARSIFEQQYVSGEIDLKMLKTFDRLLDEGMTNTIHVLRELRADEMPADEDKRGG